MNTRVRWLGRVDYAPVWREMQAFTDARDARTPDELWLLEHPPVFTQGLNGRSEHLLAPGGIPVVGIDRGGAGPRARRRPADRGRDR
jgi:lipoyl(octanoyl) transferase